MNRQRSSFPAVEPLRKHLGQGKNSDNTPSLRDALHLGPDTEDKELSFALVQELTRRTIQEIKLSSSTQKDPRESIEKEQNVNLGRSYLDKLGAGKAERLLDIARVDDPSILISVLRAGTLSQRRSALRRIGKLLQQKELANEKLQELTETLSKLRDVEIAHELAQARALLPGIEGRRQRTIRREWESLVLDVEQEISAFWDGIRSEEPITKMPADLRAQLFAHVPDLPDIILHHITAIIENTDGITDRSLRHMLIASLRYAGDPRLVPSLRTILSGKEPDLIVVTARALGHIGDPRVHDILRANWDKAVLPEHRIVLAGALAVVGDMRGAEYVRGIFREGESGLLELALDALAHLGTSEDYQAIAEILEHDDPMLVTLAIKTLGRIGDNHALVPLQRLHEKTKRSGLRAEIEEAEAAIQAHMELLGEEPPPPSVALQAFDTAKMAVIERKTHPTKVGFRTRWHLFVGYLWLFIGMFSKAIVRFEAAASLRPDWVMPVLAIAMSYARREQFAQALTAFRRVVEIDRSVVEQSPARIRALVRSFLRRADNVERSGRLDVAYGLLEEVLTLDLRKAPSGMRFALNQRHEQLRNKQI